MEWMVRFVPVPDWLRKKYSSTRPVDDRVPEHSLPVFEYPSFQIIRADLWYAPVDYIT